MANQLDVETQNDQHGTNDDSEHVEVRNSNDVLNQPQVPQATHIVSPRRSIRNHQSFTGHSLEEYVMFTDGEEPESFEEATESEQKIDWIEVMQDEMKSLHDIRLS